MGLDRPVRGCERRGGDAPVNVDWFALLDTWVETGVAPATITAAGGGAAATSPETL